MVAASPDRTAPTVERCACARLFGVRWTEFIDHQVPEEAHDPRGMRVLWPLWLGRLVRMPEKCHTESCRRVRQDPLAILWTGTRPGSWWRWTSYGLRLLRHAEGA